MRTINEVKGNPAIVETFPTSHDLLGRAQPRRIALSTYIELAVRSAPDRFREVPRAAIEEDGFDDEGPFAMVRCPCGHQPIARYSIDKCSGCERYYVACAARTFVLYGEMELPAARSAPTSADASS